MAGGNDFNARRCGVLSSQKIVYLQRRDDLGKVSGIIITIWVMVQPAVL